MTLSACTILLRRLSMLTSRNLTVSAKSTLFFTLVLLSLAGCASKSSSSGAQGQSNTAPEALSQYELIAIDLINAMLQVNELNPSNLPDIKLSAPKGSFGGALFTVLDSAGYNVRRPELGLVLADLKWAVSPGSAGGDTTDEAPPQTFSISVNGGSLSREYQLSDRKVTPASNLVLKGVKNTPIKLYDELFDQEALPSKEPVTAQARREEANAALGGSVRNIFDIGGSNYQDQITMFSNVGAMVINFPDESAKLPGPSRVQLRRFLNSVSRGSDAVWVIGCSIGSTARKGGNESLARARTKAVADWLKKSGMDDERLFDESCWAEEPQGLDMPRRGVQLTLLRERRN